MNSLLCHGFWEPLYLQDLGYQFNYTLQLSCLAFITFKAENGKKKINKKRRKKKTYCLPKLAIEESETIFKGFSLFFPISMGWKHWNPAPLQALLSISLTQDWSSASVQKVTILIPTSNVQRIIVTTPQAWDMAEVHPKIILICFG